MITKIIKKLITTPSVSGSEDEIQKFIFRYLSDLNLKPFYVGQNVVVRIKGKGRNGLIFNAHVDTVSPGTSGLWKHDPYSGRQIGDKIFGLGASDEKSAVAALLLMAKDLFKVKPLCDVWLAFVCKEELDGSGTKEFIRWFSDEHLKNYNRVAGVLGEPTGLNKIEIAHKGNIFLKVTTHGESGHGSQPEKIKVHAVSEMFSVSAILEDINKSWNQKYINKFLGKPTIGHLTSISAGEYTSPNKFPDSCIATFDIRTIPEMHNIAIKVIKNKLKKYEVDCVYPPVAFGYTDKDEAIVKIFQEISRAEIGVSESSNDMCFFTDVGIPAVVFGPGETNLMHKPNEYCEISKVEECIKIYKAVITSFSLLSEYDSSRFI